MPLENVVMNSLSLRVVSWTPKPQIDASSVTGESGRPSRTGLSANAVAGNNAATAASKRKANRLLDQIRHPADLVDREPAPGR